MERKNFKKITRENLKTCREIVLSKGDRMGIECETCLFSSENTKLNCEEIVQKLWHFVRKLWKSLERREKLK